MLPADSGYRFCPRCGGTLAWRVLKESEPQRLVCQACEFVFYLDPKVAACTICMVDGGIVLLKRSIEPRLGTWVFPGGFVDRGEAVSAAAVREILDVYSFPSSEVVVVVYAAEVVGGTLCAGDECSDARAFPPESIPWGELAFESTRAALRDYVHRFFPRVRVPR